jgi:hypothetical protein
MLESQENKFREIMAKLTFAGACGWCAMDAAIAYMDGNGISSQIENCNRMKEVKCRDIVKDALDKIPD